MIKSLFTSLFLIIQLAAWGQTHQVSGYVKDDFDQSIPGVTVLSLETGYGTATDLECYFEMKLPKGTHTLELSFVGMENSTKQITL